MPENVIVNSGVLAVAIPCATMQEAAIGPASVPDIAKQAVLGASGTIPEGAKEIRGWNFDDGNSLDGILGSMAHSGFQAGAFGQGVHEINRMLDWRDPTSGEHTKIFLGFTSNLMSAGTREQIKWLVKHCLVDVIVTTAGGIEEDFIKCLAPTYSGDFALKGTELRSKGLNRIGNMIVPNSNYCLFEDWIVPIFKTMMAEQLEGTLWTPSSVIARLGKEIDHEDSVYYWAQKNGIPVYCPALTDGSLGDMLYFFSYSNSPGLSIDIVADIRAINDHAVHAKSKTGAIILGGGVPKHHILNANLFRNGADFGVFVNTAQEFDGSDSGAKPDEAISWGKLRLDSQPVKIHGDATILFPLLISQTFAKLNPEQRLGRQIGTVVGSKAS